MKVLFISLGCDKNLADSEYMLGLLREGGISITDEEEEADVIVVNTCCFIGDAKEESIQTILDMAQYKTDGKRRGLIVAGCLAERYREEIRTELPEVDAVLGTNSCEDIVNAVHAVMKGDRYESFRELAGLPAKRVKREPSTGGHYAYLKIAEGCDKRCTYCIIPSIRGAYRSVPLEELLVQARELVAQGVKELILVAQETTLYGLDLYGEKSLGRLLSELNRIQGDFWIRILYCYPEEIDDALLDAILQNEKVCHYLDLPIQHSSDAVLRRMGRKTGHDGIVRIVKRLKERIPDICLRTTLICGFPGETEGQHEELMQFINEMEFDRLGAFAYSPEEGTPAETFPDQLSEERKSSWRDEVMELQQEVSLEKNKLLIGKRLLALVEGKVADEDVYAARTYRDAPGVDGYVFIHTEENLMTGDFVNVLITGAYEYDLLGEVAE